MGVRQELECLWVEGFREDAGRTEVRRCFKEVILRDETPTRHRDHQAQIPWLRVFVEGVVIVNVVFE